MEMEKKREIKHLFHEHPLVFVEDQSNEGEKAYCSACGDVISDPCFSCVPCNYHLHNNCALAPERISSHPLHPQHSGFFLRKRPLPDFFLRKRPHPDIQVYGCALCKEKRNMFYYQCNLCIFSLDIKCANLSSSFSKVNQEPKHDFHPHPLTFIQSPKDKLKSLYCSCCHEPLVGALYICVDCPLIFHKTCIDGSNKFKHPSHRIHPIFLESKEDFLFCKLCRNEHFGFFYCCSLCDFKINIFCARPKLIVEDKSRHQHPFTLYWRQGSFICDACDTEGNYMSYICSTCSITVHKDCISLPRIIKFSRHDHCLFHKYFLEIQELTRKDCKICFNEVNLERGSYSCVKSGCNYIVHVNCALEDYRFYEVVERESQCEEVYGSSAESTQSSITRVVEVSEDGEATKIEHFSHEGHCLVLADKMEEETDRRCDGCMLPVSTLFYYCSESECHFYLHKNCAELPRIKRHWFRRSPTTLDSTRYVWCGLCKRPCSGFFYVFEGYLGVCLRCAEVPDVIEFQGHEHLLFYDLKCRERCNGCGADPGPYGAFRCGKCSFTLDFKCLSLPHSVVHKIDEHQLNLTYHDDNDYSKHLHCDICEVKRDRSLWYYCCSICDTSAHPDCILGEFPFLKDGITLPHYPHGHHQDVQFHRKAEDYPNCSSCGQRCRREIVKCTESTCNYIAHFKCWWLGL